MVVISRDRHWWWKAGGREERWERRGAVGEPSSWPATFPQLLPIPRTFIFAQKQHHGSSAENNVSPG